MVAEILQVPRKKYADSSHQVADGHPVRRNPVRVNNVKSERFLNAC